MHHQIPINCICIKKEDLGKIYQRIVYYVIGYSLHVIISEEECSPTVSSWNKSCTKLILRSPFLTFICLFDRCLVWENAELLWDRTLLYYGTQNVHNQHPWLWSTIAFLLVYLMQTLFECYRQNSKKSPTDSLTNNRCIHESCLCAILGFFFLHNPRTSWRITNWHGLLSRSVSDLRCIYFSRLISLNHETLGIFWKTPHWNPLRSWYKLEPVQWKLSNWSK